MTRTSAFGFGLAVIALITASLSAPAVQRITAGPSARADATSANLEEQIG